MNDLSAKILAMAEASTLEVFSTMANLQGTVVSKSVEIGDVPVEGVGGSVSFGALLVLLHGGVLLLALAWLAKRNANWTLRSALRRRDAKTTQAGAA